MPKLRNFEQLLFVKQLYEDSKFLVNLADTLSLTKSLILVDLAIEQTLKTVILNLNPSFYIPRGKKDILWKDLWKEADDLIKKTVSTGLIEEVECTGLRELRNLVQHRGVQPTNIDVRRAVESAEKMLIQTFLDAFNIDFENLRRWNFIDNLSLRNLLLESEFFWKKMIL